MFEDLKFWFYGRKSTDSRDKQINSLETQSTWKDTEQLRHSFTVVDEYIEAETATKNVWRPEFYRMIEDIENGRIDAILTYEVDRLARNFREASIIQELSQYGNIKLIYSWTWKFFPEDILSLGVKVLMAVNESHQMKKKMKDGLRTKVTKWGSPGAFKYGYNSVNRNLVINEEEAFYVRKMFELRLQDIPVRKIVQEVNNLWYLSRQRYRKNGDPIKQTWISKSIVERILSNPVYTGMIRYNGEFYTGSHPAIIDLDTFETINQEKKILPRRSDITPLKGKVFFEGKPLTVSENKKKKIVYFHKHSWMPWEKLRLNQNEIIKAFDDIIHLFRIPEDIKQECVLEIENIFEENRKETANIKISIRRRLSDIEKEIDGLVSMRMRGELDTSEFLPRKNKLISEKQNLNLELMRLDWEQEEDLEALNNSLERTSNLDQCWFTWGKETKLNFISENIDEIKVVLDEDVEPGLKKQKRLYIEGNPIMQAFRKSNIEKWWSVRGRCQYLAGFLWTHRDEVKKMWRVFEKILSQN